MSTRGRLVVVGASLATNRLLRTLRRRGFDRDVVLVGAEPHRPYDRPPLSKQYLAGASDRAALELGPSDLYDDVELRLGTAATRLLPAEGRVELADGTTLDADDVVVATGAHPRRLPGQPELDGLFLLRTVEDATALRAAMEAAGRVVVVGAGLIGSEVASTARGRGLEVTVLETAPVPMVRGVGPVVGAALARLHRDAGVDLRLRVAVETVLGPAGRVQGVRLADGDDIPAEVVVVGVGATPTTGWLAGSGLTVDDGVVTDDRCRALGGGGHVWAIGDVARWPSARFGRLLRTEHWTGAVDHATTLAANLLGEDRVHDPIPYVWSDQFGHKVQVLGDVGGDDEVAVLSGDLDDPDGWVVGYLRDGGLTGVVGLDRPRDVMRHRALIQRAAPRSEVLGGG